MSATDAIATQMPPTVPGYASKAEEIVAYVRSRHVSHEKAVEYVALGLEIARNQGVIDGLTPIVKPVTQSRTPEWDGFTKDEGCEI